MQPTNPHSETYEDKVFSFLINGKFGASYTIDTLCAKENQPRFIKLVKEYMAMTPWAGGWEFNDGYTKLRRVRL